MSEKNSIIEHIRASIIAMIVLGIICCGVYPLLVWGIGQVVFPQKADGSLIDVNGTVRGSALIGQNSSAAQYFHPRPSANGYDATNSGGSNLGPLSDKLINGVPATTPAASPQFDGIRLRAIHYAMDNGIPFKLYLVNGDQRAEVPLKNYEDAQGNLNDNALLNAFPHPESDTPDKKLLIAADFATPIPGDAVTASASGLDPHISPANARIQASRVAAARKISVDQVMAMIEQHTDGPDLGVFGDPGVNVLLLNLALDAQYPIPVAATTQAATKP